MHQLHGPAEILVVIRRKLGNDVDGAAITDLFAANRDLRNWRHTRDFHGIIPSDLSRASISGRVLSHSSRKIPTHTTSCHCPCLKIRLRSTPSSAKPKRLCILITERLNPSTPPPRLSRLSSVKTC